MASLSSNRIHTLDALRGLAALAVCWFHFTRVTPHFKTTGILEWSGRYGNLGVEVFFVISGFVIPYTLWRLNFTLKDYRVFVTKRIVRLDPPYIASIALIIVLAYLSALAPGYKGDAPEYTLPQILTHLAYANIFFDYPWIDLVYWSLAIEFQYYLLIALLFPCLMHTSLLVRWGSCVVVSVAAFSIPNVSFVFHWFFLFLLGILTFYYKVEILGKRQYLLTLMAAVLGVYLTHDAVTAYSCIVTALIIAFVQIRSSVLTFFGEISFSLYLLHVPIGGRVINLGSRVVHSFMGQILTLIASLVVTIVAAYIFYRFVERPAQRLSSRMQYNRGLTGLAPIIPTPKQYQDEADIKPSECLAPMPNEP